MFELLEELSPLAREDIDVLDKFFVQLGCKMHWSWQSHRAEWTQKDNWFCEWTLTFDPSRDDVRISYMEAEPNPEYKEGDIGNLVLALSWLRLCAVIGTKLVREYRNHVPNNGPARDDLIRKTAELCLSDRPM